VLHRRPGEVAERRVGAVRRVETHDLVSGLAQGLHGDVDRQLCPRCDDHLSRVDVEALVLAHVVGDGGAELGQAARRRVVRVSVAECGDPRFDDVLGRREVRLAAVQRDDRDAGRAAAGDLGEDLADVDLARRRGRRHPASSTCRSSECQPAVTSSPISKCRVPGLFDCTASSVVPLRVSNRYFVVSPR
jgi:hypothetical protein